MECYINQSSLGKMGYYEVGKKQIVRFYNFLIKFYIVLVTGIA
ncbi:hypothetical protein [Clostridium guangxiense]|nr:hypothetical protein [Clostridium guangxiense]